MATYQVEIEASIVTDYEVEAKNKEEAIRKAVEELKGEFTLTGVRQAEAHRIVDNELVDED